MKRWLTIATILVAVFGPLSYFALSDTGMHLRDQAFAFLPAPKPQAPEGVELLYDIPYGTHPRHKLDIYLPKNRPPKKMSVILLVHGGGWAAGEKTVIPTTLNSAYLNSHGWMVISINYRLTPEVSVVEQAQDVMHAIAYIQKNAAHWNADPHQIVVMGHSSGGHLVALATAYHKWIERIGGWRWPVSISLDGSVYDVIDGMSDASGLSFFSPAFGTDPSKWAEKSPAHNLKKGMPPLLAICTINSTCGHPQAMLQAAQRAGVVFEIQRETLDHGQISSELGKDNDYTKKVFSFVHRYAHAMP